MEENNESTFKTVQNPNSYKTIYETSSNTNKEKLGFGKGFLLPFFSSVLGCTVVIGTCFGVPSIKNFLLSNSSTISTNNNNNSTNINSGLVEQISLSKYSDTSIYAANKILPSIVGIKVEYSVNSALSFFSNQPQTSTASASGSGIIISDDGYILTNNHIVATSSSESYYEVSDANKVTVTLFNDETEYEAKIIGKDEQTDLAVIKIEKDGLTKAEFADSDSIKVGEFAMAVGSPLGLDTTVTTGIISAVNREVEADGTTYVCIQTDAAINSGNSGGALVNGDGKVIGINTLKLSGSGVEGIGFAIPINSTHDVIDDLIEHNKVLRPYIGIGGIDLDEQTVKYYKLASLGVYVKSVQDFSPAEKAGLQVGDIIIKADGKDIKNMDELNKIKNTHKIGEKMTLIINRNGTEKEITVTLEETP